MPIKSPVAVENIEIKRARVHNLKGFDLSIPRNEFVVITGLSGSGKSSLAFDTLYAEGQRRYAESLSSYARQFLGRIHKPDVEAIRGIPPAIAIEQKVNTRNPRSTVGTSTEIYDYLKLLYARVGRTISPVSGKEVKKHSVTDVVDHILKQEEGKKLMILAPFSLARSIDIKRQLEILDKQGITRIVIDGQEHRTGEIEPDALKTERVLLVVDRIVVHGDEDSISRYGDSIQSAFSLGKGECLIKEPGKKQGRSFSNRFELDGISFEEPTEHMFSFNNPLGACPVCEGYGKVIGIDEDLVIPNKRLSVYEDAIVCWKGEKMKKWKDRLIYNADQFGFPVHKPYYQLSDEHKSLLWTGNRYFKGLNQFFKYLERKKYKIQYRVMLSRYRGKTTCQECMGTRLKKEATWVKVNGQAITDLVELPINELDEFLDRIKLTRYESEVAGRILVEIRNRVKFLLNVGLSYLTLNRLSSSLSGGESQRINLATSLGSSLVGSLYILDEPSIGLHPRDTSMLIRVLEHLKRIGNTVLVVEHDADIIRAAGQIIDIGPGAGRLGGEIIFQGTPAALVSSDESLTARYLTGKESIEVPASRRKWNHAIRIAGAREHNLKNISVDIPLNVLTVVTGVSGSGKSSLVKDILYPALNKIYHGYGEKSGEHDMLDGDLSLLRHVEFVDQNPIGRSSRSNPVTYIKAYDEIRKLFADQHMSEINNFKPAHFSFNVDGGRCDVCQGEGEITVEMQFMADVHLVCEQCQGKRFKDEVLEVKYQDRNIYDVLEMTVDEAMEFFSRGEGRLEKKIVQKLKPLQDVGLGYIKLGQSSSTLSGGESQRVKLAFFLSKEHSGEPTLFIFDEPTTGLHFHDIRKLLEALNALISQGHSVLIIEHNMEVIKSADWIIDLGPEGGEKGGEVLFTGTPEVLVKHDSSSTGKYLNKILNSNLN